MPNGGITGGELSRGEIHQQASPNGGLQDRDAVEFVAEGLLAGLVAEQRPARIGPRRAAHERPAEQGRFADPPTADLGQPLVDPEAGKGGEVDGDGVVNGHLGGEYWHCAGLLGVA